MGRVGYVGHGSVPCLTFWFQWNLFQKTLKETDLIVRQTQAIRCGWVVEQLKQDRLVVKSLSFFHVHQFGLCWKRGLSYRWQLWRRGDLVRGLFFCGVHFWVWFNSHDLNDDYQLEVRSALFRSEIDLKLKIGASNFEL